MKEKDLTEKELNIYNNLKQQMFAEFKHIRTGSYQSKYRYRSSMEQMCMYLAKEFRKQSLKNMKEKHFRGFAEHMKQEGKANATITTDMAGVRYYFDHVSKGRIKVPSNKELGIQPRTKAERINVNRAMPEQQYVELIEIAQKEGKKDIELQIKLGYHMGFRIHEILGTKRYDLKNAIYGYNKFKDTDKGEKPFVLVKGKTGLIRKVYIETKEQIGVLREVYQYSKYGNVRVFDNEVPMHKQIKRLQKFVANHRNEKLSNYKVTPHSLRHSYAQNMDKRLLNEGNDEIERKRMITKSLGHGRLSVVDIYLESVEDWNEE